MCLSLWNEEVFTLNIGPVLTILHTGPLRMRVPKTELVLMCEAAANYTPLPFSHTVYMYMPANVPGEYGW